MIEFKIDGFRYESSLKAKGDIKELLADASYLIQSLHTNIKKRNPADAEKFKSVLRELIDDKEIALLGKNI